MKISKEDAKLLCRIAWRDSNKHRHTCVDCWLVFVFEREFSAIKTAKEKNGITKTQVKEACQVVFWDSRVNSEHYKSADDWIEKRFKEVIK